MSIGEGQRIFEGRRVRVRGRVRPISRPAVPEPIAFRPVVQQPPTTDLQCPDPEGLQLYPDPATCNGFYKVNKQYLTIIFLIEGSFSIRMYVIAVSKKLVASVIFL